MQIILFLLETIVLNRFVNGKIKTSITISTTFLLVGMSSEEERFCFPEIYYRQLMIFYFTVIPGGMNQLPYLGTINFSIHGSHKRFFENYLKALGLNQEYMLLKLRNSYYIVLICPF